MTSSHTDDLDERALGAGSSVPWNAPVAGDGPSPDDMTAGMLASAATYDVPLAELLPADSPRFGGEDEAHARTLAATDAVLPPILVHRSTMRVIDGMHRLQAAMLRNSPTIRVRYFEGSEEDAYVLAVRANVQHGKPLSLAEREAAARRMLHMRPEWSDRAVASVCGISSKTVGSIRKAEGVPRCEVRLGLDGRVRPVDASPGRREAAAVIRRNPSASLREVARVAGVSPGTVRDVKARLLRGVAPVRERPRAPEPAKPDVATVTSDPAIAASPTAVRFLPWLTERAVLDRDWERFVDELPLSRVYLVANVARAVGESWLRFAKALESRANGHGDHARSNAS